VGTGAPRQGSPTAGIPVPELAIEPLVGLLPLVVSPDPAFEPLDPPPPVVLFPLPQPIATGAASMSANVEQTQRFMKDLLAKRTPEPNTAGRARLSRTAHGVCLSLRKRSGE